MCGCSYMVLFMGNLFTTLRVVYQKYKNNQDKSKSAWDWKNEQARSPKMPRLQIVVFSVLVDHLPALQRFSKSFWFQVPVMSQYVNNHKNDYYIDCWKNHVLHAHLFFLYLYFYFACLKKCENFDVLLIKDQVAELMFKIVICSSGTALVCSPHRKCSAE